MDNKDIIIIGLVVLLVVAVLFSTGVFMGTTANAIYSCTDTDNGNIYTKGTIKGVSGDGQPFGPKTDYCSQEDSRYLMEYTCNGGTSAGWSYGDGDNEGPVLCDNGCSNGACI